MKQLKLGNIVKKNGVLYTYHATKPHAVTDAGSVSCDYDANGSVTRRGIQYLRYDAENRAVKVASDAGGAQYVARYAYDGDGRRVKRVDSYGTIHYVGPHYERNVGTGADTAEVATTGEHQGVSGGLLYCGK